MKSSHPSQVQERELMRLKGTIMYYRTRINYLGGHRRKHKNKLIYCRQKEYDLLKYLQREAPTNYILNAENQTRAIWQIINN